MATFIGLLRAVNVGGTGLLAMKDLVSLCGKAGFTDVRTYIQSGNVVVSSRLSAEKVRVAMEGALASHTRAKVDVIVRTADELAAVLAANPFPDAPPAKVIVHVCSDVVPAAPFKGLVGPDGELVSAARREIYVHYVSGQGRSKLKLPRFPGVSTARNMNTIAKLVAMSSSPVSRKP